MDEFTRKEFLRRKEDAANRIRDMYNGHSMPPYPDFVSIPQSSTLPHTEKVDRTNGTSAPITDKKGGFNPANLIKAVNLEELTKSPDNLLILGIILLIFSDTADEKLILALLFIML